MRSQNRRAKTPGDFLQRFAARVRGFGERPLRLCDLYGYCERSDIEIIELQMRKLHGGACEVEGYQYIFINPLVSYAEQIVAGYHELFHILNHDGVEDVCHSSGQLANLSKGERQAQAVGVVALLPYPLVGRMSVSDMMREFDIPRRLAEFRFKVYQEFQF